MTCHKVLEGLSAYVDEELDPIQNKRIQVHLSQCAGCQKEFEAFVLINKTLGDLLPEKLSPKLIRQIDSGFYKTSVPEQRFCLKFRSAGVVLKFFEILFDLIEPVGKEASCLMEEFNDFPPLSFGYIYFKIMNPTHMRF